MLYGHAGRDILVSIDAGTTDYLDGGDQEDTLWIDKNGANQDTTDNIGAAHVQQISSSTNGADLSLNGDRIADRLVKSGSGHQYVEFAGNPLFGAEGARQADIEQGGLGDVAFVVRRSFTAHGSARPVSTFARGLIPAVSHNS